MVVGLHVLGYQYMSNNVVSCCYILHWNLCIYELSLICFVNYNISPPEKIKFSHKLMSWGIVVLFDITMVKSQDSVLCIFSVLKKLNNNLWIHIKVTVLNAILYLLWMVVYWITVIKQIWHTLYFVWFINTLYVLVSPCSPNPCMHDGSCSVDVNYEATCACNREWSGFYCSSKFMFNHQLLIGWFLKNLLWNRLAKWIETW